MNGEPIPARPGNGCKLQFPAESVELPPMLSKLTAGSSRLLACPECGTKAPRTRDPVITCPQCGTKASVAEWSASARDGVLVGRADQPPATTIRRESTPGGTVWHIPARGKFGFFMFFGVLWCLITALVSGGFLFAFLTGGTIEGDLPDWLLIPFFGLFWAIGLGTLYMGVREKCLKHRLTVAAGEFLLRREMFGRHREQRLAVADIRSVEQREFYQKNYEPVHGIEIKAARAKLRFGSTLTPEEKAWLVADLREVIFGPPPPVRRPDAPRESRAAPFSVEIPHARNHLWPLAIILMVIGGSFMVIGLTLLNDPSPQGARDEPVLIAAVSTLFDLLSNGFQALWVCSAAAMAIGGIYLFSRLLRDRHLVKKLEGNATEIALRSYRHGRVWKEEIFPRGEVSDIRASTSGNSNGRPMKRLELIIGNTARPLARWIDGEAADAVVEEVRAGW